MLLFNRPRIVARSARAKHVNQIPVYQALSTIGGGEVVGSGLLLTRN
jgi:hypothetical protein